MKFLALNRERELNDFAGCVTNPVKVLLLSIAVAGLLAMAGAYCFKREPRAANQDWTIAGAGDDTPIREER